MKKYLLAAALVMVSASAMADRMVSGKSEWISMVTGGYDNKADACQSAKEKAKYQAHSDEQVESFSKCDCDQDQAKHWTCTVDAKIEKKH